MNVRPKKHLGQHFLIDKEINFTKSCRREEFLDIFNIKTFEERSPGPAAKYNLEQKPSLVKSFTKRIRKDIFDI
jgi:hypothetical protein